MAKPHLLKKLWPFLIILFISGLTLSPHLTKPFIGHHDWNPAFYSNIARNYLTHSLKTTKLGQLTSPGHFYTHYPPLMPLLLALDFLILGFSDLTARLFPLSLTILTLLVVFRMTQKLKLKPLIGLSSLLIVFTPMLRYFSHMPSQETLMIFFTVFSVNIYLDLILHPKPKHPYEFYLAAFLNGLSGWAGYFIYPLLFLHARKFHKKTLPIIKKSLLILIFTFLLHLTHTYILTGSITGGGLIDVLLLRLNLYPLLGKTPPELPNQFTWLNYLIKQARILTVYYTATLLLLSSINLVLIIRQYFKTKQLTLLNWLVILFLAWGFCYPLIFSNVVFVHEYFNLFFWPFFAFSLINLFDRFKLKPLLTAALLFLLASLIYLERQPFLQALFQSQAHRPGYELGQFINQTVPSRQTAYIISEPETLEAQTVFLEYYADRPLEYLQPSDPLPASDHIFYLK